MNKLGFGFLRLPMVEADGEKHIDLELTCRMVDAFIGNGGKYFDTAYTYLGGKSETALRETLVKRYPRDSYIIADKLPGYKAKTYEDCQRYFDEQLERCGVEKFDVYMLHWLNRANYEVCERLDEFRFLRGLKARGLADRIGFSFHDSPELLDEILAKHPCVDIVQLQINYLDWLSPSLRAGECYDVARKHGKRVVVMEPVKGGSLAKLPEEAAKRLAGALNDSPARFALRFAQSLDNVDIVLSGMSDLAQVDENMRDMPPIADYEHALAMELAEIMRSSIAVPCTGCAYCASHCPMNIAIPEYFALYNEYARTPSDGWKMQHAYDGNARNRGKASDCIGCRQCEKNCPQKLSVAELLKNVAKAFEG